MSSAGGALEFTLAEDLLGLVEDECAQSPVLLVLDDMHWADPSSRTLVGCLAREVAALPLVVVCAARLLPRRPELERMAEAIGARGGAHVYLGPLDEATCEAMAEELTGGEPGPELSARLGSCGGNPLFVSELLGALAAEGVMHTRADGSVEVNAAGLPPSLALTVLGRLSFLTSGVVEVLTPYRSETAPGPWGGLRWGRSTPAIKPRPWLLRPGAEA